MKKRSLKWRGFMRRGILLAILGLGMFAGVRAAEAQSPVYYRVGNRIYASSRYLQPAGTGIFVNGRQLSYYQAAQVRQVFGYTIPGSYWMRSDGTFGRVGGPALGNLFLAAQARSRGAYLPSKPRINHHSRGPLVVPGVGALLPDGTSVTW